MLKDVEKKAHDYSVRSFLNSFFRDYASDPRVTRENNAFVISLKENQKLTIPLKNFSLTGNHRYESGIDFKKLATTLLTSFFDKKNDNNEFLKNSLNSLSHMEKAIEKNLLKTKFDSYLESEKKLILGHPVHPYPKTKLGMNEKETEDYSPEFQGKFKLVWLKVDSKILESNLKVNEYIKYLRELSSFDLENKKESDLYLPMHPYQWKFLQDSNKIDHSLIEYIGEGLNDWFALSSTRSIYNENAPYQLKYSMNVKLTNSIRHLQPEEAIRGEFIESVFKENNLLEKYPELHVLFEPLYLSFKDKNGVALSEFTFQVRENLKEKEGVKRVLLSTLVEENIQTGKTHLSELILKLASELNKEEEFIRIEWFKAFLKNAISPLLKLAFNSDVLLGAHLQNIILELKEGVPSGVFYRDCQGTGFTEKGQVKYGKVDNGNVLSLSDINKVFGYYLVVNTIFGVISSLANSDESHEKILINRFRLFLIELRSELDEPSFIDFLLDSKVLYQKGNFRCSVNELNENTIKNPWEIYNEIPNPIALSLRELKEETRSGELYKATSLKGRKLSFSLFDIEKDLDLFHEWHHKDFVSDFWEMRDSKDELRAYIEKLLKSPYQMPLIFKVDDVSVGYFEAYWAYDDRIAPYCNPGMYDRGIHLLIGEEKYLRTYLVFESMLHVSKFLFEEDARTQKVWGEPRSDNQKIMRFAEKLPGWKFIKEFDFPHKRAALLECDRTRFYEEFYK